MNTELGYKEAYDEVLAFLPNTITDSCKNISDIVLRLKYVNKKILNKLIFLMKYADDRKAVREAVKNNGSLAVCALGLASRTYNPETPDEYFDLLASLCCGEKSKVNNLSFKLYLYSISRNSDQDICNEEFLNRLFPIEEAAKSFNRLRKYWLSMKSPKNRRYINKVAKLSKKLHKPLQPKPLDGILLSELTGKVKVKINKAKFTELVMLYNLYRNRYNISVKLNHNGTIWFEKRAGDNYNDDVAEYIYLNIRNRFFNLVVKNGYSGVSIQDNGNNIVDYMLPDATMSPEMVPVIECSFDEGYKLYKEHPTTILEDCIESDILRICMYGYKNKYFEKRVLNANAEKTISMVYTAIMNKVNNMLTLTELIEDIFRDTSHNPMALNSDTVGEFEKALLDL